MRKAAFAALMLLGSVSRADQGWQDTQNTNGFVANQPVSDCPMQSFYDGTIGCAPPYNAIWDPSVFRVYAIDYDAGDDSRQCFATAASSSFSDFKAADHAAGAVACKTMEQVGNLIPAEGAGRMVAIIIAARSGGATYLKKDGTTTDSLDSFMSRMHGYNRVVIWATGTNSTCGATKFTGDANDFLCAGAIPVTGTNAAGYNPTGGATTTTVPLTKVGGGAPGLASEPAAPLGYSSRFDVATSTAALRNVARGIQIVSTTSTANDTVSPQTDWPAVPSTSDVMYLEQPGVVCGPWGSSWDSSTTKTHVVGIRSTGLVNYTPGSQEITGLVHMFDGMGSSPGAAALATSRTGLAAFATVDPGTGVGTISRGSTLHVDGQVIVQPGTFVQMSGVVFEGSALYEFVPGGFNDAGSVLGGGVTFQGAQGSMYSPNPFIGNVSTGLQDRVFGHVTVIGGSVNLKDVQISGAGAVPAITFRGTGVLYMGAVSGSMNNTDVGLDLVSAQGTVVTLNATPSVTGAAGDVRLCDGTIITWAQAASGVIDVCNNAITASSAPITVYPAGTTIKSLAGTGTQCVTASSTGLLGRSACISGAFYQTWTDDTFTPLPQETFSTAGAGLSIADDPGDTATVISLPTLVSPGSCTNCSATFDNFGRATAYSSGTAPVTSLSALAPLFVSASTGSVQVSEQGAITTGGTSTSATNLGALSSGVLQQTVSAGVSTPSVFVTAANEIPFGAASGGGFDQSSSFFYDGATKLGVGTTSIATGYNVQFAQNVNGSGGLAMTNVSPGGSAYTSFVLGSNAALSGASFGGYLYGSGSTRGGLAGPGNAWLELAGGSGNFVSLIAQASGDYVWETGASPTEKMRLTTGGVLSVSGLGSAMTKTVSGAFTPAVAGTDYQAPLTACTDYVSVSCQGGTSDIGTGGSNSAVQVTAIHEAFGPSRIPFGNINASGQALVYDGAHIAGYPPAGDLSGSYVTGPSTACKINWYSEVINVVSSAWVPVSSMTTFTTNQAEQPCDHKATNGKLLVNVIGNALTGGSVLIYITRNGGGFGATLTVTSATTTGVHAASAATGSGSANDTYGLFFDGITGSASGTINFSAEAVLQ